MLSSAKLESRRFFFFIVAIALIGFLIFSSAALGVLGDRGLGYNRTIWNQFSALLLALVVLIVSARIPYHYWQKIAIWIFAISLILTLLVFVPGIGHKAGGAERWLSLGGRTIQPSEFLKLGLIIYLAAWLAKIRERVTTWESGFFPFVLFVGVVGVTLIAQPDIGTFSVTFTAATAMFFAAGAKWRQLLALGLVAIIGFSIILALRPYARERVYTFLSPNQEVSSDSWQINQSLIAIGSGGLTGRGFGQSLQKFVYLPQPTGDSVFAVAAEEFGFLGSLGLIVAFIVFALWGLRIAGRAPDRFSRLLVVGLIVLMTTGAFINMASMLGLFPLTGIPLLFVSHGGSALLFSMLGCGIILNISRSSKA